MIYWRMLDKLTGEERSGSDPYEWHEDGTEFHWTEGNMSCDANRATTFYGPDEAVPSPIDEREDPDTGLCIGHICMWLEGHQRFELLYLGPEPEKRLPTAPR